MIFFFYILFALEIHHFTFFLFSSVLLHSYRHSSPRQNLKLNGSEHFMVIVQSHPHVNASHPIELNQNSERYRQKVFLVFTECITNIEQTLYLLPMFEHYSFVLNIFNVVAIFKDCVEGIRLNTYSPFERKLITIGGSTSQLDEIFFDKTRNFYQKPLRVSYFHEEIRSNMRKSSTIQGPDAAFGYVLAEKLNATLKIIEPNDSFEYGNPTTASPKNGTGSLGQVIRGDVDISLNARFLRLDLFRNNNIVESTNSIGRDDMCILVPRRGFYTPIHDFVHSLDATVWSFIFIALFVTVFCIQIIAKQSNERNFLTFHLFDAARSHFNQPTSHLPETTPLRIAIIFWIIYCFIMGNVFHCCLTSTFTVKKIENQIDIVDDLIKTNLKIVSSIDYGNLIRRYVNGTNSSNHKKMTKLLFPVEWNEYNERIDRRDSNFAYANKFHMTLFYANTLLYEGWPIFHAMRECPVPFLSCYIAPFGSPLLGIINQIIGQLEQSGIFRHWEREANSYIRPQPLSRITVDPHPLRIEYIFGFYILIGGHLVALIVFAIEFTHIHLQMKRFLQKLI